MQFTEAEVQALKKFASALLSMAERSKSQMGLTPIPRNSQRNIFVKGESDQAWYEASYDPETGKYVNRAFGGNGFALYGMLKNVGVFYKKYADGYRKNGDYKLVINIEADFNYKIEMGLFTVAAMSLIDRLRRINDFGRPIYIMPKNSEEKKTLVFFEVWDADGNLVLTLTDPFNTEKWHTACVDAINAVREGLSLPPLDEHLVDAIRQSVANDEDDYRLPSFSQQKDKNEGSPKFDAFKKQLNNLLLTMRRYKIPNPKTVINDLCRHNFYVDTVYDLTPSQYNTMIKLVEDFIRNIDANQSDQFDDIIEF